MSVWWQGLSSQLQDLVERCDTCRKQKGDHPEPMILMETPQRPWQLVGTDLFEWKGNAYSLVVDYLSRFLEIARLESTTARAVVAHEVSLLSSRNTGSRQIRQRTTVRFRGL